MKILHIVASLDPRNGGPPRVVTRMAAAQASLDHDVSILCYGHSGQRSAIEEMTTHMPGFSKVHIDFVDPGGALERVFALRAKSLLRKVVKGKDVLHIYDFWSPILAVAASEARRFGIPYFVQPNGALDIWPLKQKRLKKKLALLLHYRSMLNKAAGLCLGNVDEANAISLLDLQTRHFILPLNAIFLEEVGELPQPGSFRNRCPFLKDFPFIVFLGRLNHKKGLDFLAEGFSIFARANETTQLVVIGHDEGARRDFEERIAKHHLQSRVHLLGPLHGDAKWEAFRDATCFALTSRQEGFSIAITEALACGLPVVISRECHFPEVAEFGAGEVVSLDPTEIAGAFDKLVNNRMVRESMAGAARDLISRRFDLLTIAGNLVQEYKQRADPNVPQAGQVGTGGG